MPVDVNQAKSIFLAVLELPAQEQESFLDAQCGSDDSLRRRVEAMLEVHASSAELLPRPAPELPASDDLTHADGTMARDSRSEPPRTEPGVPGSEDLTFLEPPTKPGAIGRLGHYEVLEIIGKGGFGVVLKSFDQRLHRVVAVKVLSPPYAANGSASKRFIREARAAAAIKNEHVVGIYEVQETANPPYLVMELVDGISLQDKLDRDGPMGLKEILRIAVQMAQGLAAAHRQGLVHRDIKPANVLLENGVERVKITDFGLARAVDDASVTQSGTVAGTPQYMSPEQAEGLAVDHRSDLFSLGTVLYAMCTGRPPFRASGTLAVLKRVIEDVPRPIRETNPEIPEWLEAIVAKLHAKKPEDRFPTAQGVTELLEQRLGDVQAGRTGTDPGEEGSIADRSEPAKATIARSPGALHRRRGLQLAALLGVLALAVGVALFSWLRVGHENRPSLGHGQSVAGFGHQNRPGLGHGQSVAGWGTIVDPDRDCQFATSPDGLTIAVPGGHHNLNPTASFQNLAAPRLLQKARGDFDLRVKVLPFARPQPGTSTNGKNSYVAAGLLVWNDDHNFVRWLRAANGDSGRLVSSLEVFKQGEPMTWTDTDIPDAATFLRIERLGERLRCTYSTDGATWVEVAIVEPAWTGELEIGIAAVNSTTAVHEARFGKLELKDLTPP